MIVPSQRTTLVVRPLLLALAAAGLGWAAVLAMSGGIILNTSWGRVSSRNPVNPFLIGACALMCYVAMFRQHAKADAHALSVSLRPRILAAGLVAATLVVGIRWGTFVASGSDASGYVSQAEMWLRGELTTWAPEWARDAPWSDAVWSAAPLGYRPGEPEYSIVPTYSPGLPIVMALFQAIGGRDAVYYVVPCFGAVAVWITYLLGTRLAGPWAGLLGALLLFTSPTFLVMLVQPMSDVPGAALWAVALWSASRAGPLSAAAAGAAVALAIVTRPNVAPLAAVIALLVASRPSADTSRPPGMRRRLLDVLWFAAATAPGFIAIGFLNADLYGSPLRSGYGSLEVLYSIERIWPNLVRYGGWLLETETPLMLLGLTAPFIVAKSRDEARLLALMAVVFPAVLLALYLPYLVFEVWTYLRFLLPAYPPLVAATAAVTMTSLRRVPHPVVAIAAAALVVTAVALRGLHDSPAFALEDDERRYTQVAEYVRELPARAVFVSLLHSGSIRHYTGRDVLRWELVEPLSLDTAIAHIRSRGHHVYLVVDRQDVADFKARFANSQVVRELDRAVPVVLNGTRIFAVGGTPLPPSPRGG